jgi:hypothetical protein
MIFLNYWASSEVGSVADQEEAMIQPAGFTFSIWGLIYLLLAIWLIRLTLSKGKKEIIEEVNGWVVLNFLLNGLWIVVFTQQLIGVSLIVIIAILITLFIIYHKLSRKKYNWFERMPYSVYTGWVTMATIVNLFTWMEEMNQTNLFGLSEQLWTILFLILAMLIGVGIALRYSDAIYPLVFIWAFIGILANNGSSERSMLIVLVINIGILFLISAREISMIIRKNTHT